MFFDLPVSHRPPCHPPGKPDCPKRIVGCQPKCEKYQKFRAKIDAESKAKEQERVFWELTSGSIYSKRNTLRHTEAGRKALAQR